MLGCWCRDQNFSVTEMMVSAVGLPATLTWATIPTQLTETHRPALQGTPLFQRRRIASQFTTGSKRLSFQLTEKLSMEPNSGR
jgi:hypothetical protein